MSHRRFRHLVIGSWVAVLAAWAAGPAAAATITRGPYLQMPGPDRMLVVWHTDVALTGPRVDYGPTPALGGSATGAGVPDAMGGTRYTVQLSGLAPDTRYYYVVGSDAGALTPVGEDYGFTTSPLPGTRRPIRIWTFGDSGYWPGHSGTEYQDVRQAYYDLVGGGDVNAAADATDVMLYLGDNAYLFGDDATHQSVFFGPPELAAWLRRQPFLSAIGNHEGYVSDSLAQSGDYYDMFYFPTANELGVNGVASGSESYYSLDYGNIHFVVLDSEDNIENLSGPGAAMLTWLENDLLATTADWIIAAWHRPPYSKGAAHDSDLEPNEIDMRENVLPILDTYGVDLVLCGHSHTYERTPLIDGYYGDSTALGFDSIRDGGDGDPAGQGAYRKPSTGQGPHEGTVYVVAGSSADLRWFVPAEGHPVMVRSLASLGTEVIDVDGDTLVGKFVDDAGGVADTFEIDKGAALGPDLPLSGCAGATRAKLLLRDNANDDKDRVVWKWAKGEMAAASVNPLEGADLRLCVYDAGGKVLDIGAPDATAFDYATVGDLPSWLWKSPREGLFLYKDKLRSVGGLQKLRLKTGSKAVALVRARGPGAGVPALPLALPVSGQLVNSDTGECWGAEWAAAKKNQAGKFIAVAR